MRTPAKKTHPPEEGRTGEEGRGQEGGEEGPGQEGREEGRQEGTRQEGTGEEGGARPPRRHRLRPVPSRTPSRPAPGVSGTPSGPRQPPPEDSTPDYFSSARDSPRIRRATISCWICWVPSKMSRILRVARPLLEQLGLAVADRPGQLDAAERDVRCRPGRPWPWPSRPRASWACGCRPSTPPGGSAGARPPSRPPSAGTSRPRRTGRRPGGRSRPRTPACSSSSRVRSSAARAQPTAIAATSGRVLSKVAIAPAKPCLTSTSGEPRRFSAGTRQSSNRIVAVSEARMPSLCSSRSTFMPGVPFGHHERLDRGAAELLVERRPDHDARRSGRRR